MPDLIIVGGGPAGVSSALQAARAGLDLELVSDQPVGGLVAAARRLDNLPGFPDGIPGPELARRLERHLGAAGVALRRARVTAMERTGDGRFRLSLEDGARLEARAVCLATGTEPATLPAGWGEDAAGVARDVRGLPESLEGRAVAVIGGGEAALDSALNVLDRGGRPVVLARGAVLRACARLLDQVRERRLEVRLGVAVEAVQRDLAGRWRVRLAGPATEALTADHLLACLGRRPRLQLLGELRTDDWEPRTVETPVPGLFLAGDLIHGAERFVATAQGDGQAAALRAIEWLGGRQ